MNLLISAGPTREYFDSVRFITNASSGKMGYAIAGEAAKRGHRVTLVSGPVAIPVPKGVKVVRVVSAAEMAQACKRSFRNADVAVMTAAVSDYRPATKAHRKIPKLKQAMRVQLEPTEDIAAALGSRKGKRLLVGFAMEDHGGYAKARRKYEKKNCDLIVLNGPENLGAERAAVELYTAHEGWSRPIEGTKARIARKLVVAIEKLAAKTTES